MPPTSPPPDEPSGLLIFVLAFVSILVFFVLPIKLIELRQAGRLRLPWGGFITSSQETPAPAKITAVEVSATTATTPQQVIAEPQNDSNGSLLRAKVEALAAMVLAGKVGQTEGIYVVFGEKAGSSNPRYLLIRDLLREELARRQPQPAPRFRPLSPEQQQLRDELGLERKA